MSKVKIELLRFLVAGFSAVGTDLIIYYLLLNSFNSDVAKAVSFLSGTVVAFIINKYWTFEKHDNSYTEILKFSILYTLTLGVNIMSNKTILEITDIVLLAFIVATGISTVLNFVGQKWWGFK